MNSLFTPASVDTTADGFWVSVGVSVPPPGASSGTARIQVEHEYKVKASDPGLANCLASYEDAVITSIHIFKPYTLAVWQHGTHRRMLVTSQHTDYVLVKNSSTLPCSHCSACQHHWRLVCKAILNPLFFIFCHQPIPSCLREFHFKRKCYRRLHFSHCARAYLYTTSSHFTLFTNKLSSNLPVSIYLSYDIVFIFTRKALNNLQEKTATRSLFIHFLRLGCCWLSFIMYTRLAAFAVTCEATVVV